MKRRKFFSSFARAAAIIGLAPALCFRPKEPDFDEFFRHKFEAKAVAVEGDDFYTWLINQDREMHGRVYQAVRDGLPLRNLSPDEIRKAFAI